MRTDLVADTLTRIRNACAVKAEKADVIKTKLNLAILEILKREDYISNLKVLESQMPKLIRVYLKYDSSGKSAISGLKRISRSGLRRYVGCKKIPRVLNGLGLAILTTAKGVITNKEARKAGVGGEILAFVW